LILTVVDTLKEVVLLSGVLDVSLDEKAVRLGVDLLNHRLEGIERTGLSGLYVERELRDEVLADNAI
jgi:hypothetical protein